MIRALLAVLTLVKVMRSPAAPKLGSDGRTLECSGPGNSIG